MENVTIIIQGLLEKECYDFYLENYKNYNVVISTWNTCKIDFSNAPDNFTIVLASLPKKPGYQNIQYQLVSTVNALKFVNTKYTIKIRGDEYWSNLEYSYNILKKDDKKLYTSSIWFRHHLFIEYHISDHYIIGTTENIKCMFNECLDNMNNNKFLEYHPEVSLAKSYLNKKFPNRFGVVDGRILMRDAFEILDIDMMKNYKLKANSFKKSWYNNFKPHENYSINSIDKLFNNTNFYDTNIT